MKHSPHFHSQPVWSSSIRCQFGGRHQFDLPVWKETSYSKQVKGTNTEFRNTVTNLWILELFQFLPNRLIYSSKILQLLQQKSSLPRYSPLISGRLSGILDCKRKTTYNNGSWMPFPAWRVLTWCMQNCNTHTANSSSMASLKDTSCMAAELAAASASVSIFRKGLFPSARSPGLKEEQEGIVLS